jgi:hypothetical protein
MRKTQKKTVRKTQKKTGANDHGQEVHAFRSRYGVQPLEYMLKVINDDKLPMQLRCDMAEAALPFLHQKLKPIGIDDLGAPEVGGPEEHSLDLSKLTDEELEQLEQILAKAK